MAICGSDETGFGCTLDIGSQDYLTASLGLIVGILDKRERREERKKIINKYDRKQSRGSFSVLLAAARRRGASRSATPQSLSVLYSAKVCTSLLKNRLPPCFHPGRRVCRNRRVTFVTRQALMSAHLGSSPFLRSLYPRVSSWSSVLLARRTHTEHDACAHTHTHSDKPVSMNCGPWKHARTQAIITLCEGGHFELCVIGGLRISSYCSKQQ